MPKTEPGGYPKAGHAYPGDTINLRWSVREIDRGVWRPTVYLRTTLSHAPGDPRGEVIHPIGSRTIASSEVMDGGVTFYLDTLCADIHSAQVSLAPRPYITDVSPLICERSMTLGSIAGGPPDRNCGDIRISGSGFGDDSLPYRHVFISGLEGRTVTFETVSWSDTEIVLHPTSVAVAGDYSVAVSSGESRYRQLTGNYRDVLQVRWQDRVDMVLLQTLIVDMFRDASMTLDNLTERTCRMVWYPLMRSTTLGIFVPSGLPTDASATGPLTDTEIADLRSYCNTSHDSVYCTEMRSCSIYREDGSFFRVNSTDEPWPIPLPVRNITTRTLYGTGHYYIDDVRSDSVNASMDSGGNIRFRVNFESDGREFRGFSGRDGSGDWKWPDGDMDNMSFVLRLEPRLDGGRLTYVAVSGEFSGRIRIGGLSNGVVDVCEFLGSYREAISSSIEAEVPTSFNTPANQDNIKNAIGAMLSDFGITSISGFRFEASDGLNWLIINY